MNSIEHIFIGRPDIRIIHGCIIQKTRCGGRSVSVHRTIIKGGVRRETIINVYIYIYSETIINVYSQYQDHGRSAADEEEEVFQCVLIVLSSKE